MRSQCHVHQSIFAPFLVQMKLFGSTKTAKHAQLWEVKPCGQNHSQIQIEA